MKGLGRWIAALVVSAMLVCAAPVAAQELRGTGDLAVVIERAAGSLQIIDTSAKLAVTPSSSAATAGSPRSTS